ncbi:hypothetical protein BGAPBR_I0014 (plasmid) [Borreliella garinii PBr]|uniref:Uncharacterized protein n=1 Tax=Borreliella garinii PBr TaxID=498743 RepID=B8F0Z3_BORGR|nr:hypothetical protein BGAPBR_I0014 [Borreliella garinii PBr]
MSFLVKNHYVVFQKFHTFCVRNISLISKKHNISCQFFLLL